MILIPLKPEQKAFLLVLTVWTLFFFKEWYVLTYTKVWELRRMVGKGREEQLMVMHHHQMRQLIEYKRALTANPSEVEIQEPVEYKKLPLAGNSAILRAVLYPYRVVLSNDDQRSRRIEITVCEESCSCPVGKECWGILQ